MRERIRLPLMAVALLVTSIVTASAADLTAGLEILAPGLTPSVFTEFTDINTTFDGCDGARNIPFFTQFGTAFFCEQGYQHYWSNGAGTDALGNFYQVVAGRGMVERSGPLGPEDILHYGCVPFLDDDGVMRYRATWMLNLTVDGISGNLYLALQTKTLSNSFCQGNPTEVRAGIVRISGLPTLLDIILSYQPPATLSFNVPVHPEGMAGAKSMQVWTGNVRSMPDWAQAQPLACMAARDPTPGQVVSVADTLPDPPIGEGRYYLVASQNGADRRLGRQYMNGAFSARQPARLPICQ